MPLIKSDQKGKPNVQQHVNHAPPPQPRPPRSMTPQPNSGRDRSLQRQDELLRKSQGPGHNKENNAPPSREEAETLKMAVPDGRLKSKLVQVTNAQGSRSGGPQHNIYTETLGNYPNAFDHTESLHFDESMSLTDEKEGSMRPPYNFAKGRNSPRLHSGPSFPAPRAAYSGDPTPYGDGQEGAGDPLDWIREADAERRRQGINPAYGAQPTHMYSMHRAEDDDDEGSEHDGEVEEGSSFVENTPSRTRVMTEQETALPSRQEPVAKNIKFEEPAKALSTKHGKSISNMERRTAVGGPVPQQAVLDRFHLRHQQETKLESERSRTPQQYIYAPQPLAPPSHPAPFSSKVSSLHESSSEEEQPLPPAHVPESSQPQNGTKRPHPGQDIDFDPEILETKTMADLDSIAFPTDPRLPAAKPAVDSNGTPLTVLARLDNLTKMQPENQSDLFRTLTDAEREQTAQWFLEKFRTDMQKLIEVRIERRKIALKFEMEVRQRERRVQVKKEDVEHELGELKKGGNELVKARSPAK